MHQQLTDAQVQRHAAGNRPEFYQAGQLSRLNRIIALKDLGFSLRQVQQILDVQALARWIDASGYRSAGYPRELTIERTEENHQWVTELQEPVVPADGFPR